MNCDLKEEVLCKLLCKDRGPTAYKMVDSCDGYRFGGYDDLVGTNNDFFYSKLIKEISLPFLTDDVPNIIY